MSFSHITSGIGFDSSTEKYNMESKPNNINFISNGLLFASYILFVAFSYSEKDKIRADLEKVKSNE